MTDEINCPHCGYLYEGESLYEFVTYWAEDGPKETDCPSCNRTFWVDERVRRTFGIGLTQEEADEA